MPMRNSKRNSTMNYATKGSRLVQKVLQKRGNSNQSKSKEAKLKKSVDLSEIYPKPFEIKEHEKKREL